MGKHTLLVDLDPHSGLTISLGLQHAAAVLSIYDLLVNTDSQPLTRAIAPTHLPGLDLLPATPNLAAAEPHLSHRPERETKLRRTLHHLRPRYDYILLDCGPSLGLLTINALVAADAVIVPLQCDYLAMTGANLLLEVISQVKQRLNPSLKVAGIVATMFDLRTSHARQVLEEMKSLFGALVFNSIIHYTVRLKETPLLAQSILTYDRHSPAANAFRSLAREVINNNA
jgi:chromosome partitioning protein